MIRSIASRSRRLASSPVAMLFLLAPIVGELVSSSSPFPGFLMTWLPLAALYGCGALLVREVKVRRGLGWPAIFMMGAAYGILEEGIVVRSFFDPGWVDLGLLADYGRAAGVNWTWSHLLTIFHAVISIALPILAVEISFPHRRDEPWLTRRGVMWCTAGLVGWVAVGASGFMDATGAQLTGAFVVAGLLVAASLRIVPSVADTVEVDPRPRRFFWLATVAGFVTFLIPHAASENPSVHAVWPSIGITIVPLSAAWLWDRWTVRGSRWTDADRAALVGGGLMWLALLVALTGNPVTIATSIATMLVWHRWSRRFQVEQTRQMAPV